MVTPFNMLYNVFVSGVIMIYLIRHGQTSWNQEKRLQGHIDIPLNEIGRNEANICKEKVRTLKIDRIVASDLLRAKETACIINEAFSCPISFDSRLKELNMGDLQGRMKKDISDELWNILNHEPYKLNAESLADFYKRIKSFFDEIDVNENVLVVAHGGIIRMVVYLANNPNLFDMKEFEKNYLDIEIKNIEIFEWDKIHPLKLLCEDILKSDKD